MRYRLINTAQGVAIMIIWWKQRMFDRSWSVMLMMFYLNAIHFPALKKMWTSSKSPKYCIFHFHVFCNVDFQKSQVLNFFYWMIHLCSGLTEYARNLNLKWKMGLIFVWLTYLWKPHCGIDWLFVCLSSASKSPHCFQSAWIHPRDLVTSSRAIVVGHFGCLHGLL